MNSANRKSNAKKKSYLILILLAIFIFVVGAAPAWSGSFTNGLTKTAEVGAGYPAAGGQNPVSFLGKLLGGSLTPIFLAVTGMIIIIYAGYIFITARGDEQKVEKAKGLITNTVIALIVAYSAFGIVTLILPLWNLVTTGSMVR